MVHLLVELVLHRPAPELDEDEGPENVAQSNQQNTESSNNAPLLMERRDLLDARLKGHKQEKL